MDTAKPTQVIKSIALLILLTAGTKADEAPPGAVLIQGVAERETYDATAKTNLRSRSQFWCTVGTNALLIKWVSPKASLEQVFFLSPQRQIGIESGPAMRPAPGQLNGVSLGTNCQVAVVASGMQPRASMEEVKMLALSFLRASWYEPAPQPYFLAPWGDGWSPDSLCLSFFPTFHEQGERPIEEAELRWDQEKWKSYVEGHTVPGVRQRGLQIQRKQGSLIGRFTVLQWSEQSGLSLPKLWKWERWTTAGPKKRLREQATFQAQRYQLVPNQPQPPTLDNSITVYDYRPATEKLPELHIIYPLKEGQLLPVTSATYRELFSHAVVRLKHKRLSLWYGGGVPRPFVRRLLGALVWALAIGGVILFPYVFAQRRRRRLSLTHERQ